jgi:hypothetical protein
VNTRTKDLIDMALLIREENLDKDKTASAVRATFLKRATHDVPKELDPPPAGWGPVSDALAKECDLTLLLAVGYWGLRFKACVGAASLPHRIGRSAGRSSYRSLQPVL